MDGSSRPSAPGAWSGCRTRRTSHDPSRDPRYPHVVIDLGDLDGPDGNAFAILGAVLKGLQQAGVAADEIVAFVEYATVADYAHLFRVARQWVTVLPDDIPSDMPPGSR